MPADEGPLSRWSRRKAATRRRGGAAPVLADTPSADRVSSERTEPSIDEAAAVPATTDDGAVPPTPDDAAALDLPDIDSLGPESDFTVFMKEGVPAHLRNLALRKLWTSDPVLANLDGLVDYGGDFTHIKSGVFEAMKAVLDSGDEGPTSAEPPDRQPTDSETAQADAGAPRDAGPEESDRDEDTTTDDDAENPRGPADDPGNTTV